MEPGVLYDMPLGEVPFGPMLRSPSVAAAAAMIALVGCSADEEAEAPQVRLKMYTWWTKDGEKQALDSLEAQNRLRHANVSLSRNESQNADAVFDKLDDELAYRRPPDTFQVNGGSPLLSRVVFERAGIQLNTVAPSRLRPLTREYANANAQIWSFLYPLLHYRGAPYGVPLNLHRINNLYFSIPKLMQWRNLTTLDSLADLKLPKDIDGFMALVRELEVARGGPPLGIGIGNPAWTIETLVFENLLPSVAITASDLDTEGRFITQDFKLKFFERFWRGQRTPRAPFDYSVLDGAFRRAQELWPHVKVIDLGAWSDPFDDLMNEDSSVSLVVMGDWATGYLEKHGAKYMKDFGFVPFPGTEELFIYTTDTLTLTAGADHERETRDFLETALNLDVQLEFNSYKGSVPALVLDASRIDELERPFQKEVLLQLLDDSIQKSVAFSGLVTRDLEPEMFRIPLAAMLTAPDPVNGRANVHHAIENYYWLLQLWSETIAGGS